MENNGVLKAAVYCRLSRDDGYFDESESITNQKMLLTEYCLKMKWEIYDIYCDDDYSGLDNSRPDFNRLINDAQKGKFDIVICKNQSRFSRDMETVERYIHNLFPIWKIRFIGVVDNADNFDRYGKKARQINGLINEWYCEDISENVKAALNIKKRNGQYLGFWCPYGYRLKSGDSRKLEIDPEPAEVVKRIFNQYCKGVSIKEICCELTKDKIKTPYEYKQSLGINYFNPAVKKENAGIWSTSTVRKILKDRTYTGALIQGREKKVSYKSRKIVLTPPDEWIVVENCHKGIIDDSIFKKVAEIMALRQKKPLKAKACADLAGKVYCSNCGSRLNINNCHGVIYLRCPKSARKSGCEMKSVKYAEVEKAIKNSVCRIIDDYADTDRIWRKYSEYIQQEYEVTAQEAVRKSNMAKNALVMAYMDFGEGKLSSESFELIKQKAENDITFFELQKEKICCIDYEMFSKVLRDIKENISFSIINSFISRVEAGSLNSGERSLNIHWRF